MRISDWSSDVCSSDLIETPSLPSGLGLEAAGIVEALGDGVVGFEPGDAVSVISAISMAASPPYAEYNSVPENSVVKQPADLNCHQAAAAWLQYLTAFSALVENVRARTHGVRGKRV